MSNTDASKAYKILTEEQWQAFKVAQSMDKSLTPLDSNDGYIHLSTADQASETYGKFFKDQSNIVLVEIDLKKITVKWEPSRGGQLFPHCYDSVPLSAVIQAQEDVTPAVMEAFFAKASSSA
jgi:uncharacterized protein (DUF952 family)